MLKSEVGTGSVFTLFLPLTGGDVERAGRHEAVRLEQPAPAPSTPGREPKVEPAPPDAEAPGKALEGRKVLVIDDDARNVYAVTSLLESRGANVIFAETAQQGIEALSANPDIDVVLMDIMMPEMDGYEATREIRSAEQWAQLPIIALTAKAMPGDREKCIEAGCTDFVPKPVDNTRLLTVMNQWLRRP